MTCCEIKNLSFRYPDMAEAIINNFSLSVQEGEFVVLCGPSGCGKTTLLRQLLPGGEGVKAEKGEIFLFGERLDNLKDSCLVGYVKQDPSAQITRDTVDRELRRHLPESDASNMRCAEMVTYLGIKSWYHKKTDLLSGGQKQLLNLAAELVAGPKLLILDEPTSQLDPIASSELLETVARVNRELGITVIMTEHRLEEILSYTTQMVIMDRGSIVACGSPGQTGAALRQLEHGMFSAMPAPMQVYAALSRSLEESPVNVREGRVWLEAYAAECPHGQSVSREVRAGGLPVAEMSKVWFRYTKDGPDVLKGLKLEILKGRVTAVVGGNGTGKSTLAGILAGKKRPYRGKMKCTAENIVYLPQDPLEILTEPTLLECLLQVSDKEAALKMVSRCRIERLLDRSPESLSGGERQLAAICRALLQHGDLYILDEATKGLDKTCKILCSELLDELVSEDTAVLLVSHDLDYCAEYADYCVMLFDGIVISEGKPGEFFSGSCFYTTSASVMSRTTVPGAITADEIISAFSEVRR